MSEPRKPKNKSKDRNTNSVVVKNSPKKRKDAQKKAFGDFGNVVELNVGGKCYTTSLSTLLKVPDSMLAVMFSGRYNLTKDSQGRYFIDRDGKYFRFILNYLRDGDVLIPDDTFIKKSVIVEARFYALKELEKRIAKQLQSLKPMRFDYSHNFDKKGLIYWLGTLKYQIKQFINPGKTGKVIVQSSGLSTSGRGGNISLTRRDYDFIGRDSVLLYTHPMPFSWFSVDFTPINLRILPSHYTLKHGYDIPEHFLRHWDFLGSKDGENWVILKSHSSDANLRGQGYSTHTWKIDNHDNQYYSHFRIRQTGVNSSEGHHLVCCGFEIYGDVYEMIDHDSDDESGQDGENNKM